MKKIIVAIGISLVVGFAAASWMETGSVSSRPQSVETAKVSSFDDAAPVEERIRALELAVLQEQQARQLLEDEILALRAEIEPPDPDAAESDASVTAAGRETRESFIARRYGFGEASTEGRLERLIEAGFPPGQAEWILRREGELTMERLQARYEAMRGGEEQGFFGRAVAFGDALREDLGDADYERYLEANGRSTSVGVRSVIANSPADRAGLQPGDRIIRYDGERVFSMMDVTQRIMQGEENGNVVIDIERNGTPMQLVIPRGPLGVMGN
jgi:hypothetical protein